MRRDLPRRVYVRGGRYYYVSPDGKWHGLTRVRQGLPSMHRALAEMLDGAVAGELMPAVVTRWADSKVLAGEWSPSMKRDMDRVTAAIAKSFAEFAPRHVTAPTVAEYLKPLLDRGRTYNLHRSVLRQVMSYAALEGLRDGHNPVDDVPQRKLRQRTRIVTDAEVQAIKAALMLQQRGGRTHCLMLDLCLLTGQRIGDVLRMRWQDVTDSGLLVRQGKTGAQLLIEWSPPLLAVVNELGQGRDRIGHLLVQHNGKPYRYAGVRSAWVRALSRAGIEDMHIHDLRGRAGADRADESGIYEAQRLLGHESVSMTERYVKGKTRMRAKAAGGK